MCRLLGYSRCHDHRLSPGAVLGDFVLLGPIESNDGEVSFDAVQISLDRSAVVTVLEPDLAAVDDARDAFVDAVRDAASKPGAQPCEPLALGEEDGYLYKASKPK